MVNKPSWEVRWNVACARSTSSAKDSVYWVGKMAEYDGEAIYIHLTEKMIACLCLMLVPP